MPPSHQLFFLDDAINQPMQNEKASLQVVEPQGRVIGSSQVSQNSHPSNQLKVQQEAKLQEVLPGSQLEKMAIEDREEDSRSLSERNDGAMQIEVKQEKQEDITMGNQIVDLNQFLFFGIVQLCRKEGVITEDMAHSFINNHTIGIDKRFIRCSKSGNFQGFDFEKCKIHLFDHRKLTNMLVQSNPEKYLPLLKPQRPYDFLKETQEFLKELYEMSDTDYQREWEELVIKNCQSWWGGPERIDPICDPPVKFYETEAGQKIRIEREESIRIQTQEEARAKNTRINTQRTVNQDLKDIASMMNQKLYSEHVKIENSSDGRSSKGESQQKGNLKSRKEKKVKKEKKEKKDKKKKHKKQKKSKGEKDGEPKMEPESRTEGPVAKSKKK